MKTILEVFDKHGSHLKFDKELHEQLRKFGHRWTMKGEHINFLSNGTIGEQQLIFSILDENILFQEILKIDVVELHKDIISLEEVNPTFHETSNERYHTIVWLIHMFNKSKLKEVDRIKAIDDTYNIFAYMKMSSLISGSPRFRKHLADPNAALATFESLNYKFIIKEKESWANVFHHAAQDFHPRLRDRKMSSKGVHYDRLVRGTTDDFLTIIMGISTKLSGYINNIYSVYMDVIEGNVKGSTTSIIDDHGEDGTKIKEDIDNPQKHVTYIRRIISNKNDFLNSRMIAVIIDLSGNVPEKPFRDTLEYISDNYLYKREEIDPLLDASILSGMEYLNRNNINGGDLNDRIIESLDLLRGKWLSPKGQDKGIPEFKDRVYKYVREASGKKSRPMLTKTTIAVGLYIYLRAIVGDNV